MGTMIDGNLETLLPLAGSEMGVILCHLAGVPLGSEEAEAHTSSTASDFLELEPRVTPAIGTWGGATIVNDVDASVRVVLEETGVPALGEEVACESTSNILTAGVPAALLLTVALHLHATILLDLYITCQMYFL